MVGVAEQKQVGTARRGGDRYNRTGKSAGGHQGDRPDQRDEKRDGEHAGLGPDGSVNHAGARPEAEEHRGKLHQQREGHGEDQSHSSRAPGVSPLSVPGFDLLPRLMPVVGVSLGAPPGVTLSPACAGETTGEGHGSIVVAASARDIRWAKADGYSPGSSGAPRVANHASLMTKAAGGGAPCGIRAPRLGLEPRTAALTVRCSAN